MSRLASVICFFSIALSAVVGCDRHNDSLQTQGDRHNDSLPTQDNMIVGRWETTENDPKQSKTIWEFTKDGTVTGSSGPEVTKGTFKFLNNDTLEIAWNGMEKVAFRVRVTNDELERRVVSINLGDGERAAEGPTIRMKRSKP